MWREDACDCHVTMTNNGVAGGVHSFVRCKHDDHDKETLFFENQKKLRRSGHQSGNTNKKEHKALATALES